MYSVHLHELAVYVIFIFILQAITVGFFAEFPQPVKNAAEAIGNAR